MDSDFRPEAVDRLHLDLPAPHSPTTLAQTKTPGWDLPWSPRAPGQANGSWNGILENEQENEDEKMSLWQRRKKRIRVYMLTNTYVPLVSVDLRHHPVVLHELTEFPAFFSYSDL